jgi:hypothetical protein
VFVAQLLAIETGDDIDPIFLKVKYDVRSGTDQERLAINPGKDDVRVSNLRPSLITSIEPTEEGNWLRMVAVMEEREPRQSVAMPSQPGLLDRLKGKVRR